jgi:Ras-related protein Rab-21
MRLKVVLLGEGRVGKTSILLRYVRGEFAEKQQSTLQASYLDKRVSVGTTNAQLSVWDTAGQERFHALGPIYYRDADGALLVYDITDAESFSKVRKWVKELRKIVGDGITIVIAGNKIDLERNRQVDEKEVLAYAESVGATHFYTSAKQNTGLNECFLDIARRTVEKKKAKFGDGVAGLGAKKSKLVVLDDVEPGKKKSGCC